ncbi:LPS biosynthesis sugar transferase [Chryseobacterium piscicola]|uniref:LPS biosynthesis sugar transferase n=1 Tax=Chryseobacterium piscicola TaxID=551459 RepID=A0A2S7KCD6_9FLAO|nr:LPS biosynthesis sugar transferase [Chryseobacterium piscicola]
MWKLVIDYGIASVAVIIFLPIFIVLFVLASVDTGFPGVFTQDRVGRFGTTFTIYKFKTYHSKTLNKSQFGRWLRKTKLDELPQIFNILKGDMSIIGARPDIKGYYDVLEGEQRLILNLKPGLISEAGIKYRNEDEILANQDHPLQYNDEVLFPDKVKMNLDYYKNLSLKNDLKIIWKTLFVLLKIDRNTTS